MRSSFGSATLAVVAVVAIGFGSLAVAGPGGKVKIAGCGQFIRYAVADVVGSPTGSLNTHQCLEISGGQGTVLSNSPAAAASGPGVVLGLPPGRVIFLGTTRDVDCVKSFPSTGPNSQGYVPTAADDAIDVVISGITTGGQSVWNEVMLDGSTTASATVASSNEKFFALYRFYQKGPLQGVVERADAMSEMETCVGRNDALVPRPNAYVETGSSADRLTKCAGSFRFGNLVQNTFPTCDAYGPLDTTRLNRAVPNGQNGDFTIGLRLK